MRNKYINKKVVYVDGSPLVNNPQAGIGQYTTQLISQLHSQPDIHVIVLLFQNEHINLSDLQNVEIEYINLPRRLYSFIWKFIAPINIHFLLRHKNPDFIIYPNFATLPYLRVSSTKILTIIHDLTFLHFPETVERKNRFFLNKAIKRSADASDYIYFPSDFSRNDFAQHYRTNARLITAYPGYLQKTHFDKISANIQKVISKPYLLFIGTIEPRKNTERLCNAYLKSKFPSMNIPLVIAGKNGWGNVKLPKNEQIINLGMVSDTERDSLLSGALAFTFPSIFEGFGMPVIEAMRHRVPVISSSNSSLSEIVNNTNAYCIEDPTLEQSIINQFDNYYSDLQKHPASVKQMTDTAYATSSKFTWENCAKPYIDIICK